MQMFRFCKLNEQLLKLDSKEWCHKHISPGAMRDTCNFGVIGKGLIYPIQNKYKIRKWNYCLSSY